ncbi:MAG: winged helix DNA-binding domain-containing protein [Chthoniobacterales bacterium]
MAEIAERRLINQKIAGAAPSSAAAVVAHLGAIQAQDYTSSLWAIGLRAGVNEAAVEQAIAARQIVRTWPMRGTLHFVAAEDVHWMLELLTPRILSAALNRAEQLGLDAATLARCGKVCRETLASGGQLTRPELLAAFESAGIPTDAQRGYHMIWRLAQERLICFGQRAGKQPTFVLLDEWVPPPKQFDRAAALRELARRYFKSHGPASVQDFVWWSGLRVSEARIAIESAELSREEIDGATCWRSSEAGGAISQTPAAHLLAAFDQYLLGYRDRAAVLDPRHALKIVPGSNGIFLPIIVWNGRVVGTWKRVLKKRATLVLAFPFAPLSKAGERAVTLTAEPYARFLGMPVELQFARAES